MHYKFPLAFDSWNEQEKEAINEVIQNGYFTMGERVKQFEDNFFQIYW